jgi:hypothetical protein
MTAQKLNFFFDDEKESDDFNVALRQAIKLCSENSYRRLFILYAVYSIGSMTSPFV